MKHKKTATFLTLLLFLAALFFLGPKPRKVHLDTTLPALDIPTREVEKRIAQKEAATPYLKPGNASRIVWADSTNKQKTAYSIVYLHGFSASAYEGFPVHEHIAKKYGCNLYLPRLFGHGLKEPDPMIQLTEEEYLASAKEAIAVAKTLGEKVIIMTTSTGGTMGLYLASGNEKAIDALILYSPNVKLYDRKAFVLVQPWGLQLARFIQKSDYYSFPDTPESAKYWTHRYRIEALITLQNLMNHTMTNETFHQVKQPTLLLYYFKSEKEQDNVVSIPAMLSMYDELGTPANKKRKVAMPNAGVHPLASGLWNKDIASVEQETAKFLEEIVGLKPIGH